MSDDAAAMVKLALCYRDGRGTDKDEGNAFEIFKRTAEKGSTEGMSYLAECYRDGVGTHKDAKKADEWFLKAVKAGKLKTSP